VLLLLGYCEAGQSVVGGDLESRKLRVWILVKREDIEREFALKLVWVFVVERLLKAG
jgi:hypothetical protein